MMACYIHGGAYEPPGGLSIKPLFVPDCCAISCNFVKSYSLLLITDDPRETFEDSDSPVYQIRSLHPIPSSQEIQYCYIPTCSPV